MKFLLTGGAGYIGSHTAAAALRAGYSVAVLDTFRGSDRSVIDRIQQATNKSVELFEVDVRDRRNLCSALEAFRPDVVMHFAGLKAVGESNDIPLEYFDVNVGGSVALAQAMKMCGVSNLVFSSSATVYGEPQFLPINEMHPLSATNPYGRSKLHVEEVLLDAAKADPELSVAILRYFNPVGADASGQIGEDPSGVPQNLMPFVADVAAGARDELGVFGNDYDTRDGTGLRDYIHVVDLAEAHIAAAEWCARSKGARAFNLGGGTGTTVLEMVKAFEDISGQPVPMKILPRRPGDVGSCYADPSRARDELGWSAQRGVREMCESAWWWRVSRT